MKTLVTGHRLFKLQNYDTDWIRLAIAETLVDPDKPTSYAYAGMASGVDLWFCRACLDLGIPYEACIPFEDQRLEMAEDERLLRDRLIASAANVSHVRNRNMVERAQAGIVVWDGNKGGTHNVVQQMVEARKPFWWLNPVATTIWRCF